MTQLKSRVIFVFGTAEYRAVEGNLRFLNPLSLRDIPFHMIWVLQLTVSGCQINWNLLNRN